MFPNLCTAIFFFVLFLGRTEILHGQALSLQSEASKRLHHNPQQQQQRQQDQWIGRRAALFQSLSVLVTSSQLVGASRAVAYVDYTDEEIPIEDTSTIRPPPELAPTPKKAFTKPNRFAKRPFKHEPEHPVSPKTVESIETSPSSVETTTTTNTNTNLDSIDPIPTPSTATTTTTNNSNNKSNSEDSIDVITAPSSATNVKCLTDCINRCQQETLSGSEKIACLDDCLSLCQSVQELAPVQEEPQVPKMVFDQETSSAVPNQ